MIVYNHKERLDRLREERKKRCFPIVNRGKAWYDLLTLEQETELKEWYDKWLHVTETLVIPADPIWLYKKLDTEVELL